jgi:hypothetical protein
MFAYPASRFFGVCLLVQTSHYDVGAFPSERNGHRATDATVASGDQCDFPSSLAAPRAPRSSA